MNYWYICIYGVETKYDSLLEHLRVEEHALLDVGRAAFPYPDCSELDAQGERVFANFPECAGKRDLFNVAKRETVVSDILNAVRNFEILQIITLHERLSL